MAYCGVLQGLHLRYPHIFQYSGLKKQRLFLRLKIISQIIFQRDHKTKITRKRDKILSSHVECEQCAEITFIEIN